MSENTSVASHQELSNPWYQEFWAWFILTPLIVVVFVGATLLTVAIKESDDIVLDNYYKEGRMINQRIDQDAKAAALGLRAELKFDLEVGAILLTLTAKDKSELPKTLILNLDHPFEESYDITATMHQIVPGSYRTDIETRLTKRWYVRVSPDLPILNEGGMDLKEMNQKDKVPKELWRLIGDVNLDNDLQLILGSHE
jgi:hypothetical protein